MEQIERIQRMERILDASAAALATLSEALDSYIAIEKDMEALAAYYQGPLWMRDHDDDQAGRIPRDLKRGVLSEDAVYDLLTDRDALLKKLHSL